MSNKSVPEAMATSPINKSNAPAFHSKMPILQKQSHHSNSIWNIPGLDMTTFYAAALYLHAARGELDSKAWLRGPKTPPATREFLDCLADCFARSKLSDSRDHVSATAMVREESPQKKIKLYIAKNQSNKVPDPPIAPEQSATIRNENEEFASTMINWFNDMASGRMAGNGLQGNPSMFKTMCDFSWSRLEHYIDKISEVDVDMLESVVRADLGRFKDGFEVLRNVVDECRLYQDEKLKVKDFQNCKADLLAPHARLAGETRQNPAFRKLSDEVSGSNLRRKLRGLPEAVKWINYLGRLYAACLKLSEFCRNYEQRGYTFEYYLLPSQECEWMGDFYIQKAQSWVGNLLQEQSGRNDEAFAAKTVEDKMKDVARASGNKARVHCEMQLMMHFSKPGMKECLDYFGCSKKSCWLCWQMMIDNTRFSMKGTHRKLYPRWAFPFDFNPLVAKTLITAHDEMMSMIQKTILQETTHIPRGPDPQSSARVTPAHRRIGVNGQESSHFSNYIIGSDRWPSISLPFLHLPADSPRAVNKDVYAYDRACFAGLDLSFIPQRPIKYGGKHLIFDFQLLADFKTYQPKTISDVQRFQWRVLHSIDQRPIRPPDRPSGTLIYYRTGEELEPNPFFLQVWQSIYGDFYNLRGFPWRGDIFILHYEVYNYSQYTEIEQLLFLEEDFFREQLEYKFKIRGPALAEETLKTDLELTDDILALALAKVEGARGTVRGT